MEVVLSLGSQCAFTLLGASVRLSRTQGYPKTEYSRCENDHQGVLRHHVLLSHLFPPSCSCRRCLRAKSASAQFHTRSSDVPGLGKDNWEMFLSCSPGRVPSTAEGSPPVQPQDSAVHRADLITTMLLPAPSDPRGPGQGDMRSPLPPQALFLSAVPFTPWCCFHVLLLGEQNFVSF